MTLGPGMRMITTAVRAKAVIWPVVGIAEGYLAAPEMGASVARA